MIHLIAQDSRESLVLIEKRRPDTTLDLGSQRQGSRGRLLLAPAAFFTRVLRRDLALELTTTQAST